MKPTLVLVLVSVLALAAPDVAPAQEAWGGWIDDPADGDAAAADGDASPERADGEIDGFMGLSWHADSADVVGAMGIPIAVTRRKSGYRIFTYTPMFLERDGFLNLWIDPELGLLRASYEAITSRCTEYMRRIVAELRNRHPRVPSETRGNVRLERLDKSLCSAVLDDGAALTMEWTDRKGNRLRVGAGPKDPALRMVGTNEAFRKRLSKSP